MLPIILGLIVMMPGIETDRSFRALVEDCRYVSVRTEEQTSLGAMRSSYCLGYVRGAVDFIRWDAVSPACIPGNVTADELARVLVKIADANPEFLHLDMRFGVSVAMERTYPCAKEKAD